MKNLWYRGVAGVLLLAVLATGCFGGSALGPGWGGIQAAGDAVYFASPTGKVYALEAATGNQVWEFPTESKETTGPYYARPVLVGETLLIGALKRKPDEPNLYALDAKSGQLLWKFLTGDAIVAEVAAMENMVYVGAADRKLYALDLSNGSKLWEFETGNWVWAAPLVVGQQVYVASMDHKIYSLDARTGQKQWEHYVGAAIAGALSAGHDLIYFGALDSKVHALDAKTGEEKWAFPTGRWVWGQPLLEGQTLYVGSLDSKIYALEATTGQVKWELQLSGPVRAGLGYADGLLYAATDKGYLHVVDVETHTEKWPPFNAKTSILTAPAVSKDNICIVTTKGELFAVDKSTGTQKWRFPPSK